MTDHNNPTDDRSLHVLRQGNDCLTLCYQLDAMLNSYISKQEALFVKEGGIKERMYAARTGYRKGLDEKLRQLEADNAALRAENANLKATASHWKEKYEDLKQRALKAYYDLKGQLEEKQTP